MPSPGTPALSAGQISQHMREAVALSAAEVDRGGIPFSGVVVHPVDGVLGSGVNRVLTDRDPTAHAEIVALRNAGETADTARIAESLLLASGEPCGMCYRAAFDAGISSIFYAVDADEAARYGFDYRESYRALDRTNAGLATHQRWRVDESPTPFIAWFGHRR